MPRDEFSRLMEEEDRRRARISERYLSDLRQVLPGAGTPPPSFEERWRGMGRYETAPREVQRFGYEGSPGGIAPWQWPTNDPALPPLDSRDVREQQSRPMLIPPASGQRPYMQTPQPMRLPPSLNAPMKRADETFELPEGFTLEPPRG